MKSHDPDELLEQMEFVAGRKAPYTTVPDWITLHEGLDPQAKALYAVLAMHVNVSSKDDVAWPTRLTQAEILGWSREQSVDKYLDQLDVADAIDREAFTRDSGARGVRYYVHQTPPPGYEGPATIKEWYRRRREAIAAAKAVQRKPGRPRKAVAEPSPESPAAVPPSPAAKKAAPKKAAAKQAAPKKTVRKEKTPEEVLLDKRAADGAKLWWETVAPALVVAKKMGPLLADDRQKSGLYLSVRTRIREALKAGYDSRLILTGLENTGEWAPARRELDRELKRLTGVQVRGRGGTTGPIFTKEQWQAPASSTEGAADAGPSAPDLDVFGVQLDDDAA